MNQSRLLAAGAVLAIVTTLGLVAWTSARGVAETRTSTGALCTSCHVELHDLGAHAESGCDACHGSDEAFELLLAEFGLRAAPPHGRSTEACVTCHTDAAGSALAAAGHAVHASLEADCGSCHETHGSSRLDCASCHAGMTLHGVVGEMPCTTCHRFGSEPVDEMITPPTSAGFGAALVADSLHGTMDCRRCHDPHREDPPAVECESCHRAHLSDASERGPAGHRDCRGCHEPHAPRSDPAVTCLSCHVYPERGHDWETRPNVEQEEVAVTQQRITHEGRCGTCHEPHGWTATNERCAECHEEPAAGLAPLTFHQECTSCHQPHEPQPDGAVCASCHADVHMQGPTAHRNCLSCHDAHSGRPEVRGACGSCHQDAHAESRSGRHRSCQTCHEVHGSPLAQTASACGSCHAEIRQRLDAATSPARHECAACHAPHSFEREALSRCSGCHEMATSPSASHRGECTDCHEAHAEPLGSASDCGSCHRDVHPAVTEHAECRSCHEPHRPGPSATSQCRTCHTRIQSAARTWPAASAHAGRCLDCHQAHAEAEHRACSTCHQRESNRSHMGSHSVCIDCHAQHEERPGGPRGWWARCATCHEGQSAAVAASSGTHGDCRACHASPGRPLPTCQTCHDGSPRLLHQAHRGEDCSSCHSTHGHVEIERSLCVDCHQDRERHFPGADCQSCHPF